MRKLFAVSFFLLLTLSVHAQMKRPVIMVVPADQWCITNGYATSFDDMGRTRYVPDYEAALQENAEIRSLIGSLGNMMSSYDFPLKNLEAELKRLNNDEAELSLIVGKATGAEVVESPVDRLRRSAKCDIIIDVAYTSFRNGPYSKVVFNITAIDAYSSMEVAACPPVETEMVAASMEKLLDRAVQDVKETFCSKIQSYFEDTYNNGRNARILLKRFDSCPYDFEDDVVYNGKDAELGEVIQQWFYDNCVGGQFSLGNATANTMDFSPARIPVRGKDLSDNEVASDAAAFVRPLSRLLSRTYNMDVKVYPKGLGEVWLILGEK